MSEKTKPGQFSTDITPSDTDNITLDGQDVVSRQIYVGSGGDISVEMAGDDGKGKGIQDPTQVYVAVPTGSALSIGVSRVNATNTTASSLVAIW